MKIFRIVQVAVNIINADWENIDWSKSNNEIAQEINACSKTVSVYRLKYAPETAIVPKGKTIDWRNLDWTKYDAQLAKELNVSPMAVFKNRRHFAPEEYYTSKGNTKHNIWENIDWSKYDDQIATDLKVDDRTVEKYRKYKAPEEYKNLKREKEQNYYENLDWNKTNDQLLRENIDLVNLGKITNIGIIKNRKHHAPWSITRDGGILNWNEIGPNLDWSKKNDELEKELGVGGGAISHYRGIFAKWSLRKGVFEKYPWADINWDLNTDLEISNYLFDYIYDDESLEWKNQNKTLLIPKIRRYVNMKRSKARREKIYNRLKEDNITQTEEVVATSKFKIFRI